MKTGDLIEPSFCVKTGNCGGYFCPFCKEGVSTKGLVLESWIDLDDNLSVIAIFGDEEIALRKNATTSWMNISFYEVLNN